MFTGGRVSHDQPAVCFELPESEFSELVEEEIDWLLKQAELSEVLEDSRVMRFFFLSANRNLWRLFESSAQMTTNVRVFSALLATLRRKQFSLSGRDAFDFLTLLYVDLSQALRRGGKWQYRPECRYGVIGNPAQWCLDVTVPANIIGLLIGPGGRTTEQVERYTEHIKTRISFS